MISLLKENENIKNIVRWWISLTQREQFIITLGSMVLMGTLFYLLCLAPLASQIQVFQQKIKRTESLLQWMKPNIIQLEAAKAAGKHHSQAIPKERFLSTIERDIRSSKISAQLKQIGMSGDNSVSLSFERVPFDDLIDWLGHTKQLYLVDVDSISVTRLNDPGMVRVDVRLIQ